MRSEYPPQMEAKRTRWRDAHWAVMAFLACSTLVVVLVLLAVMQYRWIAELREAERRQLELSLKATADNFAADFSSELLRVVTAFQLEYRSPSESLSRQLKDAHAQWAGSAPDPTLVRDLLIVRSEGAGLHLFRFGVKSGLLLPIAWLNALDPLKLPADSAQRWPAGAMGGAYPKDSIFLESIPAIAVPFLVTAKPATAAKRKGNPPVQQDIPGWSVVQLDRDLIVDQLLPALFKSHFAIEEPPPFRVAVASAEEPHDIIFTSEAMSDDDLKTADLVLNLVTQVGGQLRTEGPQDVRILAPDSRKWQLFVKHRMGSLDAAVEDLRRRNLAIGAGILLVLAASVVLILVSANRARTLGRLHLEFAAAVSHELRTPLAVIQAASYNLEEGIIQNSSQVRHYAGLVRDAGRRLSKMVDQILLLAETQSLRRRVPMTPVRAGDIIERALESIAATLPQAYVPVERNIQANLPLIVADPFLLGHCVQNLIGNALKYGDVSDHKPLRISALINRAKAEVQIRVSDEGPGISPEDYPHIFKPFYRGKQSHLDPVGNGLGLSLVLQLMEMQRGSLSVETTPNGGSTFILHVGIVQ